MFTMVKLRFKECSDTPLVMVSINPDDWHLLPDVPDGRDSINLDAETITALQSRLGEGKRPRVTLIDPSFPAGTAGSVVRIGDPTFFAIMRGWAGLHRYANATVAEFIAYAEQVSHQDLRAFFHDWLYRPAKPTWTTGAGT